MPSRVKVVVRWLMFTGVMLGLHASPSYAQDIARAPWESPAHCPAPQGLRASTVDGQVKPRAWVVVSEAESGWTATIHAEYAGGKGSRVLSAKTCDEVRSAALIALSLIDPQAVEAPPKAAATDPVPSQPSSVQPSNAQPSNAQPSSTPPALSPAEPAASAGTAVGSTSNPRAVIIDEPRELLSQSAAQGPNPGPADPLRRERPKAVHAGPKDEASGDKPAPRDPDLESRGVSAALGLAVGLQEVQGPMFGGALDVTARLGAWRARAELSARSTLTALPSAEGVRVDVLLAGVRFEVCRAWQPWARELVLCLGPVLQRLQGSAPALVAPTGGSVWLPGGGATGKVEWFRQGRVSLWAAAQVDLRYHRVDYQIDEQGQVGSFGRISAVLLAGPEIRF